MASFAQLLQGLGTQVGLDDLAPDEDNGCTLVFDEQPVHMLADEEDGSLLLYCELCLVPLLDKAACFERLLSANAFFGETMGTSFAVHGDFILLQRRETLTALDEQNFFKLLEHFIQTVFAWKLRLDGDTQPGQAHDVSTAFFDRA